MSQRLRVQLRRVPGRVGARPGREQVFLRDLAEVLDDGAHQLGDFRGRRHRLAVELQLELQRFEGAVHVDFRLARLGRAPLRLKRLAQLREFGVQRAPLLRDALAAHRGRALGMQAAHVRIGLRQCLRIQVSQQGDAVGYGAVRLRQALARCGKTLRNRRTQRRQQVTKAGKAAPDVAFQPIRLQPIEPGEGPLTHRVGADRRIQVNFESPIARLSPMVHHHRLVQTEILYARRMGVDVLRQV